MTFRRAAPVAATLAALMLFNSAGSAGRSAEVHRAVPMSNARMLQSALRAVCDRLVAAAPITPGTRVAMRAEGNQALEGDVAEVLLQALNARRIDCVLLAPAPDVAARENGVTEAAGPRPTRPGGGAPTSGSDEALLEEGLGAFARLQVERAAQAARADSIAKSNGSASTVGSGVTASVLASRGGALPVLAFRVAEARVDYVRQFRGGLFGSPRIERRATARLGLRLSNPGSEAVSWSASADTSLGDVVLRSDASALEDPQRPETRPTAPSSRLGKIVEPVLVVVLIAGLVSLFYQNRP